MVPLLSAPTARGAYDHAAFAADAAWTRPVMIIVFLAAVAMAVAWIWIVERRRTADRSSE